MGISSTTVLSLRQKGHDAVHLRDRDMQRLSDSEIVKLAVREKRTILTCDLDFGDILAASGALFPNVIIFRLSDFSPAFLNPRLFKVLEAKTPDLEKGSILIVEDFRFRSRRLPIRSIE